MFAAVIEVGWAYCRQGQLPTMPNKSTAFTTNPSITVVPSANVNTDNPWIVVATFKCDYSMKTLWVWIRYRWIFGTYEHSFACEIATSTNRPEQRGGVLYNYDRVLQVP